MKDVGRSLAMLYGTKNHITIPGLAFITPHAVCDTQFFQDSHDVNTQVSSTQFLLQTCAHTSYHVYLYLKCRQAVISVFTSRQQQSPRSVLA